MRVNTLQSFHSVLNLIKLEHQDISLILGTGDISHDGSADSYNTFIKLINKLGAPFCWLPGNHDRAEVMYDQSDANLLPSKSIGSDSWRILLLDSHVQGQVYGLVAKTELSFLRDELSNCVEPYVLVVLHHHVLPVNSAWMDRLAVRNAAEFQLHIGQSSRVRGVLCGHVHQEVDQIENGIRFLGSPSSCFQFQPASMEFALDDKPPGYRWLKLNDDGSIDTGISRVNERPLDDGDFNT